MSNFIHPTAVIDPSVQLGDRNSIGAFVVISGEVTIGDENWIGVGSVIGGPPEVRTWPHAPVGSAGPIGAGIEIGHRNVIREAVQVHHGWKAPTRLGSDCFIMNQCYVAHDGVVGDGATMSSSVLLAGFVEIGESANLGMGVAVHQRRRIGAGAMIGMSAVVTRDIPPFAKAYGSPARIRGANVIGAERLGAAPDSIEVLLEAYATGALGVPQLALLSGDAVLGPAFRSWAVEAGDG